jgi:hypothetical protein
MSNTNFTAFAGYRKIASGDLRTVLSTVKTFTDASIARKENAENVLIFDHRTGRQVDFDLRGSIDEVLARLTPVVEEPGAAGLVPSVDNSKPGPGRPRLGVVAAEVTLLPRHWEWLAAQPLKASGTLRRLVDEARAKDAVDPKKRIEALGTVLWSLAGNLPGFEEASRALYSGDRERFLGFIAEWPQDIAAFIRDWFAEMDAAKGSSD